MIVLLRTHAGLMIIAFCILLVGGIIARFMKKRTWWLKVHRSLGVRGAVLVLIALLAEVIYITLTGQEHFEGPHTWIGIVTVGFAVLTPSLGLLQFKARNIAATLRNYHRWSARITLCLMFINILLGLSMMGFI